MLNTNQTQLLSHFIDLASSKADIIKASKWGRFLYPGAHCAVPFSKEMNVVAWHHAIYVGNEFVIEMVDNDVGIGDIQRRSVHDFFDDNNVTFPSYKTSFAIIQYDGDSPELRNLTVQGAELWLHSQDMTTKQYNLLGNNCEHFATLMRTGNARYVPPLNAIIHHSSTFTSINRSEQIDKVKEQLIETAHIVLASTKFIFSSISG